MSTFGDHYVLSSGRTGHERLRMLCEIHDPHTRDLLQRAGLTAGHRYVEFGCGLGYVARWAREAGFEIVEVGACQPHYVAGPHKGFWSWTFEEAGRSLIDAGVIDAEELDRLVGGMRSADEEPGILVAHARTHQLIARKPA